MYLLVSPTNALQSVRRQCEPDTAQSGWKTARFSNDTDERYHAKPALIGGHRSIHLYE